MNKLDEAFAESSYLVGFISLFPILIGFFMLTMLLATITTS